MAFHGGERRPEQRQNHEGRRSSLPAWGVVMVAAFALALLAALVSAYNGWNDQSVTNAPAGTPRSTQQPDTTPPANPEPEQ